MLAHQADHRAHTDGTDGAAHRDLRGRGGVSDGSNRRGRGWTAVGNCLGHEDLLSSLFTFNERPPRPFQASARKPAMTEASASSRLSSPAFPCLPRTESAAQSSGSFRRPTAATVPPANRSSGGTYSWRSAYDSARSVTRLSRACRV